MYFSVLFSPGSLKVSLPPVTCIKDRREEPDQLVKPTWAHFSEDIYKADKINFT